MKTTFSHFFAFCVAFAGAASAFSQTSTAAAAKAVATADEMEQLVAPIALYPDVLVALVLPAAIESSDVVLAARFLERGGGEAQIDAQPWEESVKGLARYPDVVKWMDENLPWTRQLGDAYLDKPEEVMAAIQRVRARAKTQGLLLDTAEHQVVVEGQYIRIVPAQPNVVYVPRYDPEVIFVERPVVYRHDPWITFGVGFGVGWWLGYDCDWGRRVVVVNPHYRQHWRHHHDWRHHRFAHGAPRHHDWRPWSPPPRHHRHHQNHRNHFNRPGREIARPTPHHGAPQFDGPNHRRWERRDGERGERNGRREHVGRNDGARREQASPPASTWRAGPRGHAVQTQPPPSAPQIRQRHEDHRRERRDRDGDRGRERRREIAPQAPQVVATPPAATMRRPERFQGRNSDHQMRPQGQHRQQGSSRSLAQPHAPRMQAPRHVAPPPRVPSPQVAAASTPRSAPAAQRGPSIGGDSGSRPAPRISTPSPVERGEGGNPRGGGGHRGGARGQRER